MAKSKRRQPQAPGPGARVIGYLRHSSDRQERSVPQQRAELEKRAAAEGWQILQTFADEGKSGTTTEGRAAFLAMIDYSLDNAAGVDACIIWEYSRWARDENDFAYYMAMLERQGIAVISLKDSIPDGPASGIVKAAYAFAAAEESRNIGRRTRRGQLDSLDKGFIGAGRPPIGYRRAEADEGAGRHYVRWEPDPDMAPRVIRAFEMYSAGYTINEIHVATGLFSQVGPYSTMLTRPVYSGVLTYGDREYRDIVPALIDAEMWRRAQERRASHVRSQARRTRSPFILSGLLVCGRCGMLVNGHYGKFKQHAYYVCRSHYSTPWAKCTQPSLVAGKLEEAVIERLLAWLSPENVDAIVAGAVGQAGGQGRALTAVDADITKLEREMATLFSLARGGRRTADEAGRQLAVVEAQLDALQAKRTEIAAGVPEPMVVDRAAVIQLANDWSQGLRGDDRGEKQRILRQAIERVVITGETVDVFYRPVVLPNSP